MQLNVEALELYIMTIYFSNLTSTCNSPLLFICLTFFIILTSYESEAVSLFINFCESCKTEYANHQVITLENLTSCGKGDITCRKVECELQ